MLKVTITTQGNTLHRTCQRLYKTDYSKVYVERITTKLSICKVQKQIYDKPWEIETQGNNTVSIYTDYQNVNKKRTGS